MNPLNFVRPNLLPLKAYGAAQTLEEIATETGLPKDQIVKLDTGYNPSLPDFYPPDFYPTVDKLAYPDPLCLKLRQELQNYTGYALDWLACGSGSDELIELVIKAFVDPQESVLVCPPTFPMYEVCAQIQGAQTQKVNRDDNFEISVDKILKEVKPTTKIIFIDSPANPTGTLLSQENLQRLLSLNLIVVVDEAYYEYCGQTMAGLVKDYPNLIILRTFSKWAGLAGLRVGYMLANPEIIEVILKIKQPYNVNTMAQELATWALRHKEQFLENLKTLTRSRDYFSQQLSQFPQFKIIAGYGAYITIQLQEGRANELLEFLKLRGILLRQVSQPEIPNALRANLTTPEVVDRLTELLHVFYKTSA